MTARVGADLAALLELRQVLGHRAGEVEEGARGVGRSIGRFLASSSAHSPAVAPHHARGDAIGDRLGDLGRRVARVHDAMAAADRWVGTDAALWAVQRHGEVATVTDGWHGTVAASREVRRRGLPDGPAGGWVASTFEDAGWRTAVADTRADVRHVLGRGAGAWRSGGAAGRWGRAVERFGASRAGSVARLGGRVLGVAGLAVGANDAVRGWRDGDRERLVTGMLGTAAGIAMVSGFPPAQLVGAVVAGGLLVYEYRAELADGVRAVGRGIGGAAGAAADFLTRGLF